MEPGTSPNRERLQEAETDILDQYRSEAEHRAEENAMRGINENITTWDNLANMDDHPLDVSDEISAEPENAFGFFFSSDELFSDSDILKEAETAESSAEAKSSVAEQKMRELIRDNFISAGRTYVAAERDQLANEIFLDMAKGLSRNSVSSRNSITDSFRQGIAEAKERQEAIRDDSPEGYTAYYGMKLRDYSRSIKAGELVETPYVKEHLDRVKANMASGRPTFLHGHLGSGKTELAITAARQSAIERAARESAVEYCKSHPSPTTAERREDLVRAYRRTERHFSKTLRDGDPAAVDQFAPLVISGSKDLMTQDLYADKTLKLTKFNGKPLLEHKADLDAIFTEWQSSHLDELESLAPEERVAKEREEANKILELYKLKNQAFGTEVETVKQALYRGVEEGRPVIIDEINAIPATVLISLNDLLQRRPGQTCYIPGVGQTPIKEGFSITMTGNLDTSDVTYSGTNELNPAFLSRLDIIEYDYLPMSPGDGGYLERGDRSEDELYHVTMSYLVDRQGNLQLPEPEKSLEQIYNLCVLASRSQRIFAGKWHESSSGSIKTTSGDDLEPRLEKSVLSIRNLLNVLREWDRGSEKDLDKALWDGFIAGITNPDDQNLMLGLAKGMDFFRAENGYDIKIKEYGASFTTFSEIHPREYVYTPKPLETLSTMDSVDAIFGSRPEREIYPNLDFDDFDDFDTEFTEDTYDKISEHISITREAISALEVLYNQCGCTAEGADS